MAEAAGAGVDTKPEAEHFVDKHQSELIKRVSNVGPILDELLCRNVIQQESYDEIKTLPTAEEKMRELISGPLKSIPGKYIFYQILIENEPFLVEDLKRMDAEVVTVGTIKELLLKTLTDLSYEERQNFKWFLQFTLFQRSLPQIPWSRLLEEDMAESLVDVMVEKCGQKSLEVIREVLMDMNWTDLVQRLSEGLEAAAGSSGEVFGVNTTEKEKYYVEEDRPALIQKVSDITSVCEVESMESVIELLVETLKDLSVAELKEFIGALLSQPEFHRPFLSIPLKLLQTAHMQDTVFFMVQIRGQKCVKKTEDILKTMKRTDLVQRLSERGSESKKKHSADEHRSALIHKVATIAAVQQLLLEILNDLSKKQLKKFKNILQSTVSQKNLPDISWMFNYRADIVNQMVHTYGQQSVELTREVLMDMKRTDLLQMLSKPSSGLKEKHRPSLIQRVETMESVIELLLKALKDFTKAELKTFKSTLHPIYHEGHSSVRSMQQKAKYIPLLDIADMQGTVCLMVQYYGQQSVEVTKESLKKMKRTNLVQRLSDSSSRPKKKFRSAQIKKAAMMGAVKELLLETLNDLSYEEQKNLKWFLQFTLFQRSLPQIPWSRLQKEDMTESLVDVMVEIYGQKSVQVIREVLIGMNRTDLVQRLSETNSGLEAAAGSSTEVFGMNTTEKEKHSVEEDRPVLIEKVETMESVIELLLETLKDLSEAELKMFKWNLHPIYAHAASSVESVQQETKCIPFDLLNIADMQGTMCLMVQYCGQQSVERAKEILKEMRRTDLVQRLSDSSSRPKTPFILSFPSEKLSVDELQSVLINKAATMRAVKELLLETLNDLSYEEQKNFAWFLQFTCFQRSLPQIPWSRLQMSYMAESLVDVMVEKYGQKSVEVTREVLMDMNRTDLVQRLSETSSELKAGAGSSAEVFGVNTTEKEKHSVEEDWPALIQKVETLESVIELLLEALKDLSEEELDMFKSTLHPFYLLEHSSSKSMQWKAKYIPFDLLDKADMQGTVCLMVQYCGQQSVEMTKESLKKMKRTDLVQRLSDSSSRPKKKLSVDELQSALIKKAAMMRAVKELLLETLNDLSYEEQKTFAWFLQFTFFQRSLPQIPWSRLLEEDMAESLVDVMVEKYGQKSVEVTREVLMDMNRTDLVQRLSETSSELEAAAGSSAEVCGVNTTEKEKHKEDRPVLIQKVESMESVIELLLETLKHLSVAELEEFRDALLSQPEFHRHFLSTPWMWLQTAHVQDTVFLMVQICGQKCLEMTKYILMMMMRTDLVQWLSDRGSGSKKKHSADEHRSALIHKVATIAAVQQLLLETLNNLSYKELGEFKEILLSIVSKKVLPDSLMWSYRADRADMVNEMVHTYGQQSVELTWEVLMVMKRTDLVQRLSKPSSGLKDKHSVDEHLSELMQKGATITTDRERLLDVLAQLKQQEFKEFKWFLQKSDILTGLPGIPRHRLEEGDMFDVVDLMQQTYSQQSVELTKKVLMDISRYDLVQRLSKPSSGLKGPSRGLEHEDIGSAMQDSSDWTKLEPEVNSTDADEAPTYSLQSEAGNFECSVSGLRWVCKEKVSFKYQFCSWEEPMERMKSMKYMLAGPLIDITVNAGKLDEVFLPHWICIDDNPEIRHKFAVLHIDDCGDVVEKVAEVTSSHVKLSEPVFSPRAVLMKVGFPVKISCDVLIYYRPNTPFLKLHVYLIPHDPALKQALNKKKFSEGFELIQKSRPDIYLKMQQGFNLGADLDTARILPERITLRYDSQDPNFYEVFIEKPGRNFYLNLSHISKSGQRYEQVWTCEIRKDDYQNCARLEDKHSVDEHLPELMQKGATITTDRERLLNVVAQLKQQEFKEFKWFLQDSDILTGLPGIPHHRLEEGDMLDVVDLMLQTYSQQSVELTKKVFQKIHRNDLVQKL
ncbi:uncharacterized protein LOC119005785 isoform X4 [Acanthopagrus latus]|uniref:uncharacterized protein LOC119005785 isoform X4 n=1 Tax=Acanthopagrus latus TaxID=8177 RepID=UPI00187BED70|nr:uncharacterized protein LOC119005785 isoform X4 [Acanthopagrus latus]